MHNITASNEANLLIYAGAQCQTASICVSRAENKKLSKLDAMRGFTAVYVALGHIFRHNILIAGFNISFLLRFGQEAVILFFLLSGFVIKYSYSISANKSFKLFFLKRFLRIYIPLIFVFLANYFIASIESQNMPQVKLWNLLGNIFMLQDASEVKPNVICDSFLGNAPLWSLSYEWWFYMLFFIIVKKIKVKKSFFVYAISILAAITYLFYPNFLNRELMYLAIWWVGVDLASIYLSYRKMNFSLLTSQFVVIILIVFILMWNAKISSNSLTTIGISPFLELRHFFFALIAIVGAVLWSKARWTYFNKTVGLFEVIAPISFGLYISHWFLVAQAHYLDNVIQSTYIRNATYIFVCIMFSYLIERVIYVRLNRRIMNIIYPTKGTR